MKIFNALLGLVALGFFASCTNQEQLSKASESAETAVLSAGTTVLHKPIVADLRIDAGRKTSVYEANLRLPLGDLRENALAQFLVEHKCDFAVDPVYRETTTKQRRALRSIQIVVEAFPAHYVSFQQVDSLPKSILEYHRMEVPVVRSSYLTELTEPESTVGIEFSAGNLLGFQIDSKIPNYGFSAYLASERMPQVDTDFDLASEVEFEFEDDNYNTDRSIRAKRTFSLGLMKEVAVGRRLSVRGLAGLQFGGYEVGEVYVSNRSFENFLTGGLRLGTGADVKLFRNVYFVGKVHRDFSLFRVIDWQEASSTGTDIPLEKMTLPQSINVGLGLRFEF